MEKGSPASFRRRFGGHPKQRPECRHQELRLQAKFEEMNSVKGKMKKKLTKNGGSIIVVKAKKVENLVLQEGLPDFIQKELFLDFASATSVTIRVRVL